MKYLATFVSVITVSSAMAQHQPNILTPEAGLAPKIAVKITSPVCSSVEQLDAVIQGRKENIAHINEALVKVAEASWRFEGGTSSFIDDKAWETALIIFLTSATTSKTASAGYITL